MSGEIQPVKFGIALTNQHPVGRDQREALDEQLQLLRSARDSGWDSVFAAQHYLSDPLTHIQPLPYLARLAAEAGEMEVGIGILLLALHNPIEVAENYSSLDVVCGGRLIFGVGLGYRHEEYDAFGISVRERVRRLEHNLDLVRRLWAGEAVEADLPWCRLRGARLTLRPVNESGPPVLDGGEQRRRGGTSRPPRRHLDDQPSCDRGDDRAADRVVQAGPKGRRPP